MSSTTMGLFSRRLALVPVLAAGLAAQQQQQQQPAPVPAPPPPAPAAPAAPGADGPAAAEWRRYSDSMREWGRQWRNWMREFQMAQAAPAPPAPPAPPAAAARVAAIAAASRSFLGVQVVEVDAERARALKLKDESGVEITNVEPESPAAKAGLQRGDVVLEYQGQRVEGTEQFIRLVRETPAGRQVKLSVVRSGGSLNLTARIEPRKTARVFRAGDVFAEGMPGMPGMPPRVEMWFPDMPRPITGWRNPRIGIEAETLKGQFAEFFGVKEGVLVRSVDKGSAAEKAGFKAGDVITKVDQQPLDSAGEFTSMLRAARGKKSLPVTVVREKREVTLTVTLSDEEGGGPGASAEPRPGPARSIQRRDEFQF